MKSRCRADDATTKRQVCASETHTNAMVFRYRARLMIGRHRREVQIFCFFVMVVHQNYFRFSSIETKQYLQTALVILSH